MTLITYTDFDRVGKIIEVKDFSKARKPAYKLWIDFGELGIKKSSARTTKLYIPTKLIERQILAVTNFSARKLLPFYLKCWF